MTRPFHEKRLITKVIVKRDPDAYARIYDAFHPKIYRFVFFKVSSREEAEDITASVFLKVWDYLTTGKNVDIGSLSGLLYTVARRCVIDHYRQKGKVQQQSLDTVLESKELAVQQQRRHMDEIESTLLFSRIRSLKHEYQEVILLRYVEEYSIAEVAEILNKKKANVRVLLHRATKKLKELHEE